MLVRAEERAVGRVDRRLYRTYLAAWGPFFAIPIFMITMAMTERGLQVGTSVFDSQAQQQELCGVVSPEPQDAYSGEVCCMQARPVEGHHKISLSGEHPDYFHGDEGSRYDAQWHRIFSVSFLCSLDKLVRGILRFQPCTLSHSLLQYDSVIPSVSNGLSFSITLSRLQYHTSLAGLYT